MNINFNIEKRYFFVLLGAILLLGVVVYAGATNIDKSRPYHPLQQVSIGSDDTSVDSNSNEIIDRADSADSLAGIPADQFCRRDNNNCPSECKNFKVDELAIEVRRDINDGGDPDCWINNTDTCIKWNYNVDVNGDGIIDEPIPKAEDCARTAALNGGYGDGWIFNGYGVIETINPGTPDSCGKSGGGQGDTRYERVKATFYKMSVSCFLEGNDRTFVINKTFLV